MIATGQQYSVRDFVRAAGAALDMDISFEGEGLEEKGYDAAGRAIVAVDPHYFRPTEVETLLGDAGKARRKLGWRPRTGFAAAGGRNGRGGPGGSPRREGAMIDRDAPFYVAGHRGMVGGAVLRALQARGHARIVTATRQEADLTDRAAVEALFARARPAYVVLAAAKVGGILANDRFGADFIRENLLIQTNVIDAAWRHGTRRLAFLGSSCIYPREAAQPIREEALMTGPLEATNLPYAVAKIAGAAMCDAYRKQHGFDAFTVMPCNVYGVGDNFDPELSHVIAGLMRRFHEAKLAGAREVVAWGTGSPLREFIDADDLADAILFLIEHYRDGGLINAGSGQEIAIRDLAEAVAATTGFEGRLVWDATKPDGTPRKLMDSSRLHALGWRPAVPFRAGLEKMYAWFLARHDRRRRPHPDLTETCPWRNA